VADWARSRPRRVPRDAHRPASASAPHRRGVGPRRARGPAPGPAPDLLPPLPPPSPSVRRGFPGSFHPVHTISTHKLLKTWNSSRALPVAPFQQVDHGGPAPGRQPPVPQGEDG
jgi:hypothetical protein